MTINLRLLLRGLATICVLVALGLFLEATGMGAAFDKGWIDAEIKGRGLAGEALFLAVGAAFAAVGLPRQLVAFLGGYAFGFLWGTGLALAAATLGCATAFWTSRSLGRQWVAKRFPAKLKKVDAFLADTGFTTTVLIRLLPVGSNLATNLTAGVSGVGWAAFVGGSALGYIPQTMVFALAGSGVAIQPELRLSLSVALFLVSGILGVWLYRRYRRGRAFDDELDRALDGE